jgi:hypothetical protein
MSLFCLPPHDPSIDCALPGRVAASGNGAERGRACADVLCPAALGFGNGRNVGLGCFGLVAGFAEDLQVCGLICSAKGKRDCVIDVPGLSGSDLGLAKATKAFAFKEEVQAE